MAGLSQNEQRVLTALREAGGTLSQDDLAKKTGLADSAVARAVLSLSEKQLVKEDVTKKTGLKLTEEGESFASQGTPERRIASQIVRSGGRMSLNDALHKAGLAENYGPIATGWISRKKWGKIEKLGPEIQIAISVEPAADDDEQLIKRATGERILLENLPDNLKQAADRLLKRNALESEIETGRIITLTEQGKSVDTDSAVTEAIGPLTSELILTGEWRNANLRTYNVSSPVPPVWPGKYHPYLRFLRNLKRKLVALGFVEVTGPTVESAFINCDCLYMPQDHPAREIHDLYYLKEPSRQSLEPLKHILDNVKKTHENGWKTGSTGWRYKYSEDEASKLILRSHGTALSVRTLLSPELQIPGKYFAIARCFRPEFLDRTHLTEFNQAEGIVVGEGLNLRNLLGILEMFAKEVAGADRVRFKPDYFPFTEPSVELQAYKENYGWMEFGGSGIFRPEVTLPLGIKVPVLAWGLGIDRLYMMHRGIQDIRQLFTPDLEWIRKQPVK